MFAWIIARVGGPIIASLISGALILGVIGSIYVKGRIDGKAAYQDKLTKQVNTAIAKGNQAEADALKKFDTEKDLPDDPFARD